ncbi:GNAT family N-acetyltransferase [Sporosarcina sp. P17b]|uniref:GNAT family N-acetyltransferase n=1 Tax=Sporosarcina sp. P17b TaxID=2048260 RepID=UPI000C166C79|nr:GNAT family N-acetyltransferase [Sporosarcina sp. P17b]PIC73670.1 GNAT family N-acetyltransferase [Sporosarcina sp. P17b]
MKFTIYTDPHQFAIQADPILERNEDVYSLFYGVLVSIKSGSYQNPFMAVLEKEGHVLALLQMTAPYPLNIIIVEEDSIESIIDELVARLREEAVAISSVIGVKQVAFHFASKWTNVEATERKVVNEGIYRLDTIQTDLTYSEGHWRNAVDKDVALIAKWYTLFEIDAELPPTENEVVQQQVEVFIQNNEVFVWEVDGRVVSMMKKARPTKHGVTVSMVFTPEDERKKGYARSLVAKVSAELLKEYDFCILFTDLANPTANKIYREIGYQQITGFAHVEWL